MNARFALVLIALHGLSAWTFAQNGSESAASKAERERIPRERAAVEARFASQEVACYQRFAVNDCLNQAKVTKREALADLRRQEVSLNNAERKRKGAEQVQRMEDKSSVEKQQERVDQREKALQQQQDREDKTLQKQQNRGERQGDALVKKAEQASRQQSSTDKSAARAQKASESAEKKRSLDEKIRQAAEHRISLAKRLADKDKPPSEPLPPRP
jgi:hypothetical protein